MDGRALALVVGAAVLHAAWNALAKRGRDPLCFLFLAFTLATLGLAPLTLAVRWAPSVTEGARALPFLAGTAAIHALYFYALGASYRGAAFSVVYPMARGLGVALVPLLAFLCFGERLSRVGGAGVGLVVGGIVLLQRLRPAPAAAGDSRSGTGWAALTGVTIAGYSIVDKAGVQHLHPLAYVMLLGLGAMTLLAPAMLLRPAARRALTLEWRANRRPLLGAALLSLTAYLLVLYAFRRSQAAYVVAGRELSIVLSSVIGSVWLGEGALAPRLAASGVVLAGVTCIALAR